MPRTATTTEELIGLYAGDRCRREDWVIGTLGDGTPVKGLCQPSELRRGTTYRFFGAWEENPKWGKQFAFAGFIEHREPGRRGLVEYLTRACPGVGKGIAGQLYDQFEERAAEALRTDPAGCADVIRPLSLAVAEEAAMILRGLERCEAAKIELLELFAGRRFPRSAVDWCLERWGPSAPRLVRRNPYLMMRCSGVGFSRADQLYLDLGLPPGRLKRQTLCCWHELLSCGDGHTWFPTENAVETLRQKIAGAGLRPAEALKLGYRSRLLAHHLDDGARSYTAVGERARNEATITRKLAELSEATNQWPFDVGGIREHQAEGLYVATLGPVGLLIGSPGTGKTYTLAALIRAIRAANPSARGWDEIQEESWERFKQAVAQGDFQSVDSILASLLRKHIPIYVCAPTGKAAVRATSALHDRGLEIRAKTIHSTLAVMPVGDSWTFRYHAGNRLPTGFLIVDESSMLDTDLAASLLAACPVGMHVLFVGDTHQLAPVGHGAPLRDMIAAGLPCGELTEIERNAGTIVQTCAALKDGRRFAADAALDLPEHNLLHLEKNQDTVQVATLLETLARLREEGKYDLLRDVQILVTLNQKSPVSRVELNKTLQPILNPNKPEENQRFAVGDKVICLKNSTLPALNETDHDDGMDPWGEDSDDDAGNGVAAGQPPEHWIANGEIGYVEQVEAGHVIVTFPDPERVVRVPSRGEECCIDLAYAITVWKAQGSEWPVAIVMVDGSAGGNWLGTRELIYTAISRARDYCVTIGEQRTIDRQCRRVGIISRKTFLAEQTLAAMSKQLTVAATEGF